MDYIETIIQTRLSQIMSEIKDILLYNAYDDSDSVKSSYNWLKAYVKRLGEALNAKHKVCDVDE